MLPFAQEKRRKINLGGSTSASSQTDILHGAKARRSTREETRRRHESALCIQSHWRNYQKSRAVKRILSQLFQEDVLGLNGMRALVLIGNNDELLTQWSEGVVRAGDGKSSTSVSIIGYDVWNYGATLRLAISYWIRVSVPLPRSDYIPFIRLTFRSPAGWSLQYVNGPDLDHWVVLIPQMLLLLLSSVAISPRCVPRSSVMCTPIPIYC